MPHSARPPALGPPGGGGGHVERQRPGHGRRRTRGGRYAAAGRGRVRPQAAARGDQRQANPVRRLLPAEVQKGQLRCPVAGDGSTGGGAVPRDRNGALSVKLCSFLFFFLVFVFLSCTLTFLCMQCPHGPAAAPRLRLGIARSRNASQPTWTCSGSNTPLRNFARSFRLGLPAATSSGCAIP